jgi:OmpA-OmpF porin, OOP family
MNAMIRSGLAAALLAATLPALAVADDYLPAPMRPYIGASADYIFAEHEHGRMSDNGAGGYAGGGWPLNRFFNIELGGYYTHFQGDDEFDGRGKWKSYGARFDGQFFYSRNPEFSPYFAVGLGEERDSVVDEPIKFNSFFEDVGGGAIHYFKIGDFDAGIRGDVRYRYVHLDNKYVDQPVHHFGEPVFSLGFVIPLGPNKPPAETPPPPPAVVQKTLPPPPPPPPPGPNRRFDDVHFAFDKSILSDYAKASLDGDVGVINQLVGHYPSLKVDVSGHTDWVGTDAYNQALSERRAAVVKEYFIRKGVDAGRIRTFAYGESQPVAPNTTAEGRALNRRAEIRTNASE